MALSVLVALMMLAVPLASSSNLFVDGGQTNSNGDAPVLGASTGYTVTFQLNADGKSLDQNNVDNIISTLDTLSDKVTWYVNENDDLCALIIGDVSIQALIGALFDASGSKISKGEAYKLLSWKDVNTGVVYDKDSTNSDYIKKDMTFAAQWELKDNYVEVPVTVNFDGDVKEYVKAYKVADGKIAVDDINSSGLPAAVEKVGKLETSGWVVKETTSTTVDDTIYSNGKITYGDGKELPGTGKTIPSTSSLTVTYTFNEAKYSKIIVHSEAFKDGKDVMLYAETASDYTYRQVFDTILNAKYLEVTTTGSGSYVTSTGKIENEDNTVLTSDKHYVLSKWNGTEYLNSTRTAPDVLTLDAKLNGYSIAFMSKGQYEVKFVEFGKLTADVCTLDVSGLDHWVMIKSADLKALSSTAASTGTDKFVQFNFVSESNIKTIEKEATSGSYKVDEPVYVLIACFTSSDKTAYAVFDADNANKSVEGTFSNEYINRIVIPGVISSAELSSSISTPSVTPIYDEGNIFIDWGTSSNYGDYKNAVSVINANVSPYEYTITFYDGSNVLGVFYLKSASTLNNENSLISNIVAIQYDNKLYGNPQGVTHEDGKYKSIDAYNDLIFSKKNGYLIKQWDNADNNAMITFTKNSDKTKIIVDKVNIGDVKSDLNLYAQFEPEDYLIIYYANTATASNIMVQVGTVDEVLALFGESTFGNEGYVLKEWNTRPDGKGQSYALGADFTLDGNAYKDAADVPTGVAGIPSGYDKCVTLYAIWEKVGSGSGSGSSGDNGDDNTNTYLLAGILIVIIILIIVVAVILRKK